MTGLFTKGMTYWTLAGLGLAGFVTYGLIRAPSALPKAADEPSETPAGLAATEAGGRAGLPSDDLVDRIGARPAFSPSRRPAPMDNAPAPTERALPEDKPALELIGIMRAGDVRVALLHHPGEGLLRRRLGQTIGEWKLIDVQDRRVQLESEDDLEILVLREDLIEDFRAPDRKTFGRSGGDDAKEALKPPKPEVPTATSETRPE